MYTRLAAYWLLLVLLVGTVGGAWAQTAPPLNLNLPPQQTPAVPDSSRARTPADSGRVIVPRPAPSRPLPVRRPRTLLLQTEAADQPLLRRYRIKASLPDSLAVLREVRELVLALQGESYLTASADDMRWQHDTVRVQLYVGEKFRWARLRNGNLGDGLLTRAGYREKLYRGQPFQPQEWSRLQERILQEAENQGFPFATVRLDSAQLRGADIESTLR